jgi:F-type H+-transporting ATPase subunit a
MGVVKEESLMFSLVTALFLYIGVANLITIIPGVASVTYEGVSIFRSPTSDFNTTLGLALAMVVLIQLYAFKQFGFWGYVGKFIQLSGIIKGFKQGVGAGFMAIINFLIGLLDIVSEAAKVVSLSLRLFGNIYAGEVLAVIVLGALAYILPATWMALNILFALVQAVVFGALVAAYYSIAVTVEEPSAQEAENTLVVSR